MGDLKYYRVEYNKHKDLGHDIDRPMVPLLISALCGLKKLPIIEAQYKTTNTRISHFCGLTKEIWLSPKASWLTVIHEWAHYADWCERKARKAAILTTCKDLSAAERKAKILSIDNEKWHAAPHVKLVDEGCAWLRKHGTFGLFHPDAVNKETA